MAPDNFAILQTVCAEYSSDVVGLCYDSGHGNIASNGLDRLAESGDRLISVHLHDNDSTGDQHLPPFSGTTDWERLALIMAQSSYDKPVSMEASIRGTGLTEEQFLTHTFKVGQRLSEMVASSSFA